MDYRHIGGKIVKGTVDKLLGLFHLRYSVMIYSINYGYAIIKIASMLLCTR